MVQFNPDGSIKLPSHIQQNKDAEQRRWTCTKCIRITKEVLGGTPKKCNLHIELSPRFDRNDFIQNIIRFANFETPIKVIEKNPKEFTVEIGSTFRRCTECTKLVGQYREYSDGNFILKKGACGFEQRSFAYEDYFD